MKALKEKIEKKTEYYANDMESNQSLVVSEGAVIPMNGKSVEVTT